MKWPRWMRWPKGRRSKQEKSDELEEVRRRTDQIVKQQEAKNLEAEKAVPTNARVRATASS
jgi:hypothetical protein